MTLLLNLSLFMQPILIMHKKTIIQSILVNVFILINLNVNAQNYSGGTGTLNEPFLISSKEDLKYLSENSDQWSYNYKQITDISSSTDKEKPLLQYLTYILFHPENARYPQVHQ